MAEFANTVVVVWTFTHNNIDVCSILTSDPTLILLLLTLSTTENCNLVATIKINYIIRLIRQSIR